MKKTVQRVSLSLLVIMLLAPLFTGCDNRKEEKHSLDVVSGAFFFDSIPFKIGSVSLDYSRLPRGYWEQRIQLIKGLGVNTIMVRVPWMLHEPEEGVFRFDGECDVREFCSIAQENGLLVWLHVGPYVDAHLDMGGMPWWLLRDENMNLRSRQKLFMDKVGRFYRALASQLADRQLSRGGNIALIHIEEPDGLQPNHKAYLAALCDSVRSAGFDETLLTVVTTKENVHQVPVDKALAAYSIDDKQSAMSNFAGARKHNPNSPVLCFDVARSCWHVWGERVPPRNLDKSFARLFEVFEGSGSANVSVALGGTSFGHLAGAEIRDGRFRAFSTAYDNNSIFNEGGRYREAITMFREAFHRSATQVLPAKSDTLEIIEMNMLPETAVTSFSSLFDSLPQAIASQQPLTFEQCGVGYGAVLYTTTLPSIKKGSRLSFEALRDNAQIFIGGKRVAMLSRVTGDSIIALPEEASGATIQILVDAFGRVSNLFKYKDYKGIVGKVSVVDSKGLCTNLTNWENTPLPADYLKASARTFGDMSKAGEPGYYRTTFNAPGEGDFFLFTGSWGRGEMWINGHSLGRFWSRGAQKTLYVPGCWLKENDNELIILDYVGPSIPFVEGFKTAILD